ncbi:MAG: hypothetical protein PHQ40_05110 [Anaerolineaceae bacterium]|nr:hypothetical protein [Anaerolineaceae bacterium]
MSNPSATLPVPQSTLTSALARVWARYHWLWAVVFFTGMTLVWTWPLALRMGNSVVGTIGDNIYFVWLIEWFRKALFELHVSPVFVPFLNYPEGWNLAYTEITPAMVFLALPASLIAGPTFGYNFALMATFVLSGLAMYIWIHHLTGSKGAALVAGMIYGFLPFRVAHFLIGHLNLSGTMALPLYFMGLYDLLHAPGSLRQAWKPALLAGVSLGWVALTSQYYLYMAILLSGVFGLVALFYTRKPLTWLRGAWQGLAGFAAVAVPLVLVSVLPFVQLSRSGDMPNRTVSYVRMYSASPTDFLLPSTDHFLWGRFIGTHFDRSMWIEGTLYIGAVTLALVVLAFWWRRESSHRLLLAGFTWVALAAFILALGTDFHWLNQSVNISVPAFLRGVVQRNTMPIPLPGYFMFLYFPFFAKMRALERFGLFVLLAASVFAGLGAAGLLEKVKPRRRAWVTLALLALVFIDFYPGPYQQFSTIQARPVDTWLAVQPGKGAIAQFPFSLAADQDLTYDSLVNNKPYIGGFFAAFEPAQYQRIKPVLNSFPSSDSLGLLKELGVQYVLVDAPSYPNLAEIEAELQQQGLSKLTTQGNEVVYELR